MDGIYRYQRYIYDLTRKYFLLGRDRLLDDLRPPAAGSVLEVGCGTGRNLILTARRYPDASLYGFDISRVMLETAESNIARADLSERIHVAEGDATNFSGEALFGVSEFDRVFVSYAVSMIPPWQAAIEQAFNAVKPGGSLHVVDFGLQEKMPTLFKKGLHAWLAKFSVSPRPELKMVLTELADGADSDLRFQSLYRDYAQYAVLTKRAD